MIIKSFTLIILFSINVFSQDKVANEFNVIVSKYKKFFSSNHLVIVRENLGTDSISESYYCMNYVPKSISFDAQKTHSIIIPYKGFIEVEYLCYTNRSCGDIFLGNSYYYGWKNAEDVIKRINDDSCYKSVGIYQKLKDKFSFIYNDNKWQLKEVTNQDNEISQFAFLFKLDDEHPIRSKEANRINIKWGVLIPRR